MKNLKVVIIIVTCFLSLNLLAQKKELSLIDIESKKKRFLKIGDYTGILSQNDSINVWIYKHNKNNQKGKIRLRGMWKLDKIDLVNRKLTLAPHYKNGNSKTYSFDEIEYMHFPKIVNVAPNDFILWITGFPPGFYALAEAAISKGKNWKKYLPPAIISTISFSYIFGWGKKRMKHKKYKIIE